MAGFEDFPESQVTKMFLLGDSGSGKTGAILSLAAAGYNVRIIDLDNGLEILSDYLRNPQSIYRKANSLWTQQQADSIMSRIRFETLTDPMVNRGGVLVPRQATVWNRAIGLMNNWKTDTDDFGPVSKWTPQEVLVIDSLTFLSKAAFNFVLTMNSRLGTVAPHNTDYGVAQRMIESMIGLLYDKGVNCNVIYNCHVKISGEENNLKGYAETVGKALDPKLGRYVNSVLLCQTSGIGANEKRRIKTTSTARIELKTTAPLRVKPEYPLETGLAEYFLALRGGTEGNRTL